MCFTTSPPKVSAGLLAELVKERFRAEASLRFEISDLIPKFRSLKASWIIQVNSHNVNNLTGTMYLSLNV